jgi:DNA replication protein DnaC
MLRHDTLEKLKVLRLYGMAEAFEEQGSSFAFDELDFEARLGLLVDREIARKKKNKIQRLLKQAQFQNSQACIEDLDYSARRKINKQLILELATSNYIHHARNVNIFGATGAGKSYLGQALGQQACRQGIATRYIQLPEFLDTLKIARSYGIEKYSKIRKHFTEVPLLILDEWLMFKIDEEECKDLLQIIDRRSTRRSTIVISQYSPDEWIGQMPIQVAAEAITDRLTAQAYTITIESRESMRQVTDSR